MPALVSTATTVSASPTGPASGVLNVGGLKIRMRVILLSDLSAAVGAVAARALPATATVATPPAASAPRNSRRFDTLLGFIGRLPVQCAGAPASGKFPSNGGQFGTGRSGPG